MSLESGFDEESMVEFMPEAKAARLIEIYKWVEGAADGLGMEIDEGIKETVVYLNVLGMPTEMSCEGHTDWGSPYPWVLFQEGVEPLYRYEGEEAIYAEVADKWGVEQEEVHRAIHEQAYEEVSLRLRNMESKVILPEYQEFEKANVALRQTVNDCLNSFYATEGQVEREGVVLGLYTDYVGELSRLMPQEQIDTMNEEVDLAEAEARLIEYRREMVRFTDYLKKVFESEG